MPTRRRLTAAVKRPTGNRTASRAAPAARLDALPHQQGQVLVLVGLAMTALIALAALTIDVGAHFANRTYLQTVADAAALAGGQVLTQTGSIALAEQAALDYVITNTTKAAVPQPPLASSGGALAYDGAGTSADHLVWGIRADATTGAVWVAVTNTVPFAFARIVGFEFAVAGARAVAYTPASTTRLTTWKPVPTPRGTYCAVSIAVSALADNQGYWYTFDTSGTGTITAEWTVPARSNIEIDIYAGHPFDGQPNPLGTSPPGGAVAESHGSVTTLTLVSGSQPPGQYAAYFSNFQDNKGTGAGSGVLTFIKATCP